MFLKQKSAVDQSIRVMLINGSPHTAGCTYHALGEVGRAIEDQGISTEFFHLGTKPIPSCLGCGTCYRNQGCIHDDIVNQFIDITHTVDAFVFGSPVHFSAPSGQLTCFMDRLFYNSFRAALRGKPVGAVVTCRRGGATSALDQMYKYFTMNGMLLVGSNYWSMVHGNNPSQIMEDLEGLQTMRILGENIAWLLKCLKAAKDAGIKMPPPQTKIRTNYIR